MSNQLSADFGDGTGVDLCGPRIYELTEEVNFQVIVPPFARLTSASSPDLIIEPTGQSDIGSHEMFLEVSLLDFPALSIPIQFIIEIVGCEITFLGINQPNPSQYLYDIVSPATLQQLPIPFYTVTPSDCQGGDQQGLNFIIDQSPLSPEIFRTGNILSF